LGGKSHDERGAEEAAIAGLEAGFFGVRRLRGIASFFGFFLASTGD
jgi:hypothetical protein